MQQTIAELLPRGGVVSNPARIGKDGNGRTYCSFAAGIDTDITWTIPVVPEYFQGTGTLQLRGAYYTSATSGNVRWACQLESLPDGTNTSTSTFDTANYVISAVPGTAGLLREFSITITNDDAMAPEQMIRVKLSRVGTDDTCTATVYLLGAELNEDVTSITVNELLLTEPLEIESGGTGASAASDALNNLLPSQADNADKYLKTDGNNTSWQTVPTTTPGGSSGQVQFNSGGAFGGSANFTWDNTDGSLLIGNAASSESWEKIVASSTENIGIGTRIVCENRATSGNSLAVFEMRTGVTPSSDGIFFGCKHDNLLGYGIHPGITMRGLGSNADLALATSGYQGTAQGSVIVIKQNARVGVGKNDTNAGVLNHCDGQLHIIPWEDMPDLVLQARASQTADLLQCHDSSGAVIGRIKIDGSIQPATIADSAASNNSIYYSSDAGKLVFKDSGSVVHELY